MIITPPAINIWLKTTIDEMHTRRQLRVMHETNEFYWASDGYRMHMSTMRPEGFEKTAFNADNIFEKFHEGLAENFEVRWQKNIPAQNLQVQINHTIEQFNRETLDNPMKFKGYHFNPYFVKDAIAIMFGFITAELLVSRDDEKVAILHLHRNDLEHQLDAYIFCIVYY